MQQGKYVIFTIDGVSEFPMLFPSFVEHSSVAEMFGHKAVSAGMFEVYAEPTEEDDKDISVWAGNKSVTLGIKSRPEDAAIIKRILRHKYTF